MTPLMPLKFVWDKVEGNAPVYSRMVNDSPAAMALRRQQTVHWLQQTLGYTKAAAEAAMTED